MAPAKKPSQGSVDTYKSGEVPAVLQPISVFFEKKVRNLEKRKGKLDSYRALQKEGKLTDAGQKLAVEKYDEVVATLNFASNIMQELLPVLLEISSGMEKMSVDKGKEKDKLCKTVIRSVLDTQDLYEQLGDESVRSHFASGSEGALMLTEEQLAAIDALYLSSKPSRVNSDGTLKSKSEYKKNLDESVSSWHRLIQKSEVTDGATTAPKPNEMKTLFEKIAACDYFDASKRQVEPPAVETIADAPPLPEEQTPVVDAVPEKVAPTAESVESKSIPTDILGSLQGRVVNFVQDDYGGHLSNPMVPPVSNMVAGSTDADVTYNGGFQENYSTISSGINNMSLETSSRQPFGHFNGSSVAQVSNGSALPSDLSSNNSLFSSNAPQGTFPAAESWADEAPELFDSNMNSGGDKFVEVKRGGVNNKYGGRSNDYGRGGYRNEFPRGLNRGGGNRGGGFESRGFNNRPFRNEYRDESNQGNRQDNFYPRGGNRGFGGGGGPKEFSSRSGPGSRGGGGGGKSMRGNFDRQQPPPMFTSSNAAK